jgi:hypothetical protein
MWTRPTGHGPHPTLVNGGPRRCGQELSGAPARAWWVVAMARRQLPRGGGGGRGGRGGALTGDGAAVKWSGDGGKVAVTKVSGGGGG